MTGGAEIKFGGLEKFIYVNSRGAWGHEKFIPVWIKGTGWRPPKKKDLHWNSEGFFGRNQKFKQFFRPKTSDLQKKRSSSQKFYEIRCEFAKITKIRVANTSLSLELHSSSPDPVHFFGAQSSLWGGARPRNAPRGAGFESIYSTYAKKWLNLYTCHLLKIIVVGNNWIWCYVFE